MLSGSLIGDQSGSDIHDHVAQIFVDIRMESLITGQIVDEYNFLSESIGIVNLFDL